MTTSSILFMSRSIRKDRNIIVRGAAQILRPMLRYSKVSLNGSNFWAGGEPRSSRRRLDRPVTRRLTTPPGQ